jgi:hypothetical protein
MHNICILLKRRKPVFLHNISIASYITNQMKAFESILQFFSLENRAR